MRKTKSHRAYMLSFIRENFRDLLGEDVALLDQPGGLDILAEKLRNGEIGGGKGRSV